jgi:hypothetical protein
LIFKNKSTVDFQTFEACIQDISIWKHCGIIKFDFEKKRVGEMLARSMLKALMSQADRFESLSHGHGPFIFETTREEKDQNISTSSL